MYNHNISIHNLNHIQTITTLVTGDCILKSHYLPLKRNNIIVTTLPPRLTSHISTYHQCFMYHASWGFTAPTTPTKLDVHYRWPAQSWNPKKPTTTPQTHPTITRPKAASQGTTPTSQQQLRKMDTSAFMPPRQSFPTQPPPSPLFHLLKLEPQRQDT